MKSQGMSEDRLKYIVEIPIEELEEIKSMAEYVMSDGHDGSTLVKVYEDVKGIIGE